MHLAPGFRVGPYEIVGPLGAGGMGEVFRARDPRLGRDVAIKALPAGFARDPERLARFEREARILASLSHPNIATIFGLEDAAGSPCLVLELVEGESLAQRLARGPLSVRDTLEVGVRIAAAIEAAHERDVVHRDLKPGNVMLGPSRVVKVLDFGLARGAPGVGDGADSRTIAASVTEAGLVLGTTSYMSPEQARGQAVDRGGDVWSFGCVLFECLAGQKAFGGGTVSDVIGRVLEREPEWNALPPAVPGRLRDVVRRCLTKEAAHRPRDIGDLRRELETIAQDLSGAPRAGSDLPSLAVLYFENLASDAENEYFCAGITEDILTDLSKIRGLRVASRNAVARYRGAPADIPKVAAELGVGAVLEGSVRRAGGRVRITAQLIHADGFHLWAERYDRTLEDVFAVQEEIAGAITGALQVALAPGEAARLGSDRPDDVRAYDLYLRGRALYGRYTPTSLQEAMGLFEQAIALDPEYARAWAGVADCCGQLLQWGPGGRDDALVARGLEAARKAIALDPRLPEGYKAEALMLRSAGDLDASVESLRRALEADPRFTPAIMNLGVNDFCRGDVAGAERRFRRALEIDPQELFAVVWVAWIAFHTLRDEEALRHARRLRKESRDSFHVTVSFTLEFVYRTSRGELDTAGDLLREAATAGASPANLRALEAELAARTGRLDEARRILAESEGAAGLGIGGLSALAEAAILTGQPEVARRWFERPIIRDLAGTYVRLAPSLHVLLDLPPFAPRRLDATLVWPLEAPMIDRARFRLFREVKIESGLPEA